LRKLHRPRDLGMCDFLDPNSFISRLFGSFLLAQLHMDSLSDLLNPGEIQDALENLSQEIDPAYKQAMVRIKQQDERRLMLAMQILSWMTYARRQLSLKELQYALAVTVAPGRSKSELGKYLYPDYILTAVCAGLVVIDEESRGVRFVRESYSVGASY
jgi:hypothetical protein